MRFVVLGCVVSRLCHAVEALSHAPRLSSRVMPSPAGRSPGTNYSCAYIETIRETYSPLCQMQVRFHDLPPPPCPCGAGGSVERRCAAGPRTQPDGATATTQRPVSDDTTAARPPFDSSPAMWAFQAPMRRTSFWRVRRERRTQVPFFTSDVARLCLRGRPTGGPRSGGSQHIPKAISTRANGTQAATDCGLRPAARRESEEDGKLVSVILQAVLAVWVGCRREGACPRYRRRRHGLVGRRRAGCWLHVLKQEQKPASRSGSLLHVGSSVNLSPSFCRVVSPFPPRGHGFQSKSCRIQPLL
jgi:hypothetical protein